MDCKVIFVFLIFIFGCSKNTSPRGYKSNLEGFLDFWSKNKTDLNYDVFKWDISDFYCDLVVQKQLGNIEKLKSEFDLLYTSDNEFSKDLEKLIYSKKFSSGKNSEKINKMIDDMEAKIPKGYNYEVYHLFDFIPCLLNKEKELVNTIVQRFNNTQNDNIQFEIMTALMLSYNSNLFYEVKNLKFLSNKSKSMYDYQKTNLFDNINGIKSKYSSEFRKNKLESKVLNETGKH